MASESSPTTSRAWSGEMRAMLVPHQFPGAKSSGVMSAHGHAAGIALEPLIRAAVYAGGSYRRLSTPRSASH